MDFRLTEEQEILRRTVRDFAEKEIAPHVMEWDEAQKFPHELIPKLAELGMMGSIFPPEYGGTGLSYVDYCMIVEELARVDGSVGLSVAAHTSLCSNHIYSFGTAEQKQKYLVPLASGAWIGAWGLTEPEAGSDAGGTKTTAVRDGESWVLNGSKNFITHASFADVYVLMAVTDRSQGTAGISAFLIEKGTEGLVVGKKENKLGMRASDTASVHLQDCRLPADHLLGKEGEGFKNCLSVLDGGRISIAALAVGMAQGALDASVRYAKERRQFGRPISEFQAIQQKIADLTVKIEAARWLTYRAAYLKDRNQPLTRAASMAKLYAGEVAVVVAEQAVQIHGGYGFIKDYPAEKYYRDVKLCTIGEGTSEIQRLVIARQLLK
ncbi:MAG: acyl-CoA dehydrogenase family protein [Acidobacteria bacterium]|nr:acyl-CoA dehydrogenase family protein [Acidobacteriota bacterium]